MAPFLETDGKYAIRIAHREIDLLLKAKAIGLSALVKPFVVLMKALGARTPTDEFAKLELAALQARFELAKTITEEKARAHLVARASIARAVRDAQLETDDDPRQPLRKALQTMEDVGDALGQVDALEAIATAERRAGRPQEAAQIYQQASKGAAKIGDRTRASRILLGAAQGMVRQGMAQDGERLLDQAYDLAQREGDRGLEAEVLNAFGMLQSTLRRHDQALKSHEAALTILKGGDDRLMEAVVLLNAANDCTSLGRTDDALARLERVQSIAVEEKSDLLLRSIKEKMGAIKAKTGKVAEAVALWEEALQLFRQGNEPRGELAMLKALGNTYFVAGKDEETMLKTWEAGLKLAHELGDLETEAAILTTWGFLLMAARNRVPEAVEKLQEAIRLTERVRSWAGMQDQNKQTWLDGKRMLYEMTAWALCMSNRHEDGLMMLELLRARNLQDALRFRELGLGDVPPNLIEERSRLYSDYNALRKERIGLARSAACLKDEALRSVQELVGSKDAELEKTEEFLASVERKIQQHQRIEEATPSSIAELQKCLAKDEGLVVYSSFEIPLANWETRKLQKGSVYLAFLVTQVSFNMAYMLRDEQLADDLSKLRRSAIASSRGYPVASFKARARRVYDTMMKPAEKKLDALGIKRLTIIPDETLYSIPFEVLVRSDAGEDYGSLDYLGRRFDVDYVYSATLLVRRRALKKPEAPASGFVGFGDPDYGNLAAGRERGIGREEEEFKKFEAERGGENWVRLPQSGAEVEKISQLFKERRVLTGKDATEGAAKNPDLAKGARVVHFACHGYVAGENPMKSALVLSADGKNDGFLEAREIADLKLSVELVVLSA